MTPDLINAFFEFGASAFICMHIRATWRARSAAGVSLVATVFFFAWGAWNLFYYPHLDQDASFWAGILVMLANSAWVASIIYWRTGRHQHDRDRLLSLAAVSLLASHIRGSLRGGRDRRQVQGSLSKLLEPMGYAWPVLVEGLALRRPWTISGRPVPYVGRCEEFVEKPNNEGGWVRIYAFGPIAIIRVIMKGAAT